ncbi:MAG TPA: S8 family serine peptidase [Gemmatimonadales bacterium]|nr:S8 family serine peptidase [Gemmatimonadales bacterium]
MHKHVMRFTLAIGAIVAAACVYDAPVTPTGNTITAATSSNSPSLQLTAANGTKSYLINFTGSSLPTDLAGRISAAGGTVTSSLDQIGVALASSTDPAFASRAAKISGVASVDEDVEVQWVKPEHFVDGGEITDDGTVGPAATFGSAETFRHVQWAPDAVHAPEAWDLGQFGHGARVAIVDGGIRNTHIDLAPNFDVAHSASFVPGQPFNFDQARDTLGVCRLNDTFWHGTHVAGIVAAGLPNVGTIGIAPEATLIGVKVLHCGSGTFGAVIAGIVYAATPIAEGGAGADIINMSLGAEFPRQGNLGTSGLAVALGKATTYAYHRGVTVFAALGNNATDLDHTANTVFLPAMSPHVIAISATGPVGFALGATNFDHPASYTNFGQSAVDFAGPGGDFQLPGNAVCQVPRNPSGTVTQFCWVFDLVFSTCRGSGSSNSTYCWAAGTSMATPAAAGVAALIVGKYGHVGPAEIERRLRQSADDLGKPGNDDFYGRGRVNALRAIQ